MVAEYSEGAGQRAVDSVSRAPTSGTFVSMFLAQTPMGSISSVIPGKGLCTTSLVIVQLILFAQIFVVLLMVIFVVFTKSLIVHLLDPDKYQLPWRSYCTLTPSFPPSHNLSILPPTGIFIGVLSTAASYERRQLIRSTWASHPQSRGSDGGTDRTVVRFILGMADGAMERRLELENECEFSRML